MLLRRRLLYGNNSRLLYLYNKGDECLAVTGGWGAYASRLLSFNASYTPSLTKNLETMYLELPALSGYHRGITATVNPIDLTDYTKLCVEFESYNFTPVSGYELEVTVFTATSRADGFNPSSSMGTLQYQGDNEVRNIKSAEIDISSLNGNHYAIVGLLSPPYKILGVTIKRIWLE